MIEKSEFFQKNGEALVVVGLAFGPDKILESVCTMEELYQEFKERMFEEFRTNGNTDKEKDTCIATDVAASLAFQTGDSVEPTIDGVYRCFRRHCLISESEQYIWDNKFISAFESAQSYLIDAGKINPEQSIRE